MRNHQHIRDAVAQAEEALKIDPDNVDAHRLLARIYVRTWRFDRRRSAAGKCFLNKVRRSTSSRPF